MRRRKKEKMKKRMGHYLTNHLYPSFGKGGKAEMLRFQFEGGFDGKNLFGELFIHFHSVLHLCT